MVALICNSKLWKASEVELVVWGQLGSVVKSESSALRTGVSEQHGKEK